MMVVALVLCSVSYGEETPPSPVARDYLKKMNQPIVLRGDYYKAVTTAYQDFTKTLEENKRIAESNATTEYLRKVHMHLSNIENYDINVSQTESSYIVSFGVTFRDGNPFLVMGGGVRYVIDRNTFSIKERVLLK